MIDPAQAVYSDLQTLVMAEDLAEVYDRVSVIYIKRTKGVFQYDPRLNRLKIENLLSNGLPTKQRYQQLLQ